MTTRAATRNREPTGAEDPVAAESAQQNVRAVTRALAVLSSFSAKRMQSLAEVTSATGLDKGTTRRMLLTLMQSGFVVQDPATQQYRLGRAIRDLAGSVAGDQDFKTVATLHATALAAELHMTAFISVYDDGDVVCLERIHDMRGIEVHWWAIGGTLPYNCGGAPKLLLAFRSPDEIARVLQREPVALTPKSITDRAALEAHLLRIRQRGYEFAVDDVTLGLSALAVPVHNPDGSIAGSLSIAGLTPQMVDRGRPIHLKCLQKAAAAIERDLSRHLVAARTPP
jgi:DNA-binding IclR family transcriptional regulator